MAWRISGGALLLLDSREPALSEVEERIPLRRCFLFFFFDLDAEGFQELEIGVADFEFRIGRERGDEGSLVGGFFTLLADADGGFEDQENIVAAFFDAGDNFGDLFGIGKGFVDGLAEFLHELFELLVHLVPRSPSCPQRDTAN